MDLTKYADTYWDAKTDAVDGERLQLLIDRVPMGATVLVIDGGPGMLAERLVAKGHEVTSTDVSAHACSRARAKGLTVHHIDTDDTPLPFTDETFDCVISDSAAEHRYWPEQQIAEAARVLKPGGLALVLLPNAAHWRQRLWLLFGRFPEIKDGPSDRSHIRFFALPEMRAMLRREGLQVHSVSGWASLWVKGLYPKVFRAPLIRQIYSLLTKLRPSLFGRDLLLVATKTD